MVILMIASCSLFVNTKEIEEKATVAFEEMKFEEFNTLYKKLEKADEGEATLYINEIKNHKYFKIDTNSTNATLQNLEEIKKQVPVLSEFANEKIQSIILIQTANQLDTIAVDGESTGDYHIIIDTIDQLVEVQNKLEDIVIDTNKNLTDLEDMNVQEKYKDIHGNLVVSLRNYRDKLQEKYMFYLNDQSAVISNSRLALQGNLFAASSLVDLMQKFEQIQKELEFAGETLQQRTESIRLKVFE